MLRRGVKFGFQGSQPHLLMTLFEFSSNVTECDRRWTDVLLHCYCRILVSLLSYLVDDSIITVINVTCPRSRDTKKAHDSDQISLGEKTAQHNSSEGPTILIIQRSSPLSSRDHRLVGIVDAQAAGGGISWGSLPLF